MRVYMMYVGMRRIRLEIIWNIGIGQSFDNPEVRFGSAITFLEVELVICPTW